MTFPLLFLLCSGLFAQEEFSGPQPGEPLPDAKVKVIFGPDQGKTIQLAEQIAEKPSLLFFVHEVTRPSVGLVRTVTNYASQRSDDGMVVHLVFLTADPTETENWTNRARHALPKDINVCVSLDGIEGPGAYGLNRKMQVTGLVSRDRKVVDNFALVQPSLQADALKIAQAVAKALGDQQMPTAQDIGIAERPAMRDDGKYEQLMRPLIQKSASDEEVEQQAQKIEAAAAEDPMLKKRIHDVANRIINAGKLENYGTARAQSYLKKWAREFGDSK